MKKIDIIYESLMNKIYEPPYTLKQIEEKYPKKIFQKLKNDPVHKWRAETGIELIHKEPSKEEQKRIWNNWQLMSPQQKKISDEKSLQLFGMTNEKHHQNILKEDVDLLQKIKKLLMKYQNVNTWQEYINSLKFGDCKKFASLVNWIYPKAEMWEIQQNYSQLAQKKLNDDNFNYGNHFINKINDEFYDFAKGTNMINGIYLLSYTPTEKEKYNINLSTQEMKNVTQMNKRFIYRTTFKKGFKNAAI